MKLYVQVLLAKSQKWRQVKHWYIDIDPNNPASLKNAIHLANPTAELFGSIARLVDEKGNVVGHTTHKVLQRGYLCDIITHVDGDMVVFVRSLGCELTVKPHYVYITDKAAVVHPNTLKEEEERQLEQKAEKQLNEWEYIEQLLEHAHKSRVIPIKLHVTGVFDKEINVGGICFRRFRDKDKWNPGAWTYTRPDDLDTVVATTTEFIRGLLNSIVDAWE